MKNTLLALFILITFNGFAQFSRTHYIPPIACSNGMANDHYFYISTPSTTNVNFKIIEIGGNIVNGVVSNTAPYVYYIGTGTSTQLVTLKTTIGKLSNKGYIIEAEDQVYVSMRINSAQNTNGTFNHAGGIVSKGNSALGTTFRLGAMLNPVNTDGSLLNFGSILATENNTTATISNIPVGTILTDGTIINGPIVVTLNKNESYVLSLENSTSTISNSSKMIGALVQTDKPVAVNSGSFGGSNSTITTARDVGFDQIVSYEKTGKEYIFVKGLGTNEIERIQLIAHVNNTIVYLNGSTTPSFTLAAGQYADIDGSSFTNGNLYVTTSEPVFAYQSIGGATSAANQNMFFVPPLNCTTPRVVDNIPLVESIGSTSFSANFLNIVTEKGATVSINNSALTSSPVAIAGNLGFERYTVNNLSGNISIKSTKQVYVSYFGKNGAATYGGYYSGFDTKPEVISSKIATTTSACIPNVVLKVSTISSYDAFQWFFNGGALAGETTNSYTPTAPGYYNVRGTISGCPTAIPLFSDKTPVSECPTDLDGDGVNDNIDIDNDNDGITNCTESYGNQSINISNSNSGTVYSNSFTGVTTTSTTASTNPFIGNADGSFVTEIPAGTESFVTQKLTFAQSISIAMEYVSTANSNDLLNASAEYIVNSDTNKTITVTNPSNQLLIDTDYDGIYESGVTQYSSFEIRFRLNNVVPLAAGTGDFKFSTYLTNSVSITHKNLSETNGNKSTFKLIATCVPKDTDGDGKADQIDDDSDNDGILDRIEAQGNTALVLTNTDTNKDGIDNAFGTGLTPIDTDSDGIPDYIDWDSDNDGINDIDESGTNATNTDIDNDGIKNYRELDSDNDLCLDVIEAGFLDPNNDGILGNSPITVNSKGQVTSAAGYTSPSNNYIIAAPIVITNQPIVPPTCELQPATITVTDNGESYQWQISTNGSTWNPITNNATYNGATTNSLLISAVTNSMNNYKYQVFINKTGNSCGLLSSETILKVYILPTVSNITIVQCDDDLDGFTTFNLTVKNDNISANASNETFSYYTSLSGANTANTTELISNPIRFTNTIPNTMSVWARVVNSNNCYRVSQLTLKVVATQIPLTFNRTFEACDDLLDINGNNNINNNKRDGIATFDFSSAETDIKALLLAGNYTVRFYKNQNDALAEINNITNINNYRNIGYPNSQQIWGRVDSDSDNACFGLGPYVTLNVEKLPFANTVTIPRQCDDNQDGVLNFNTSTLQSTLLNGQTNVSVSYFDNLNNPLKDSNGTLITSPFPTAFSTKSQIIKAIVTNNSTLKCLEETNIEFIVDKLPQVFPIPNSLTTVCDDEADPLNQDGKFPFNSSTFESTLLGSQTGMTVTYYDQIGNMLPSPLPNPFLTSTQSITVKIENPINNSCPATTTIPFTINPLPYININKDGNENELICSNIPTFYIQLNAGIKDNSPSSDYSYKWFKNSSLITNQTNPTLDVNSEGIYTVDVTTKTTGCSRTRSISVTPSDIAKISYIEINDLADTNSITVDAIGLGDYEYSIDDPNNSFQDSNIFNDISSGIHTVYVRDTNGCGTVSQVISVIGAPKFFTPNGDGHNDYWNLKGISTSFNSKSIVYIYDRYGKLLSQINPLGQGWDGTYNNNQLPADDYWFTVKLEDGRETKGHFSLKR
ncbi:T9SS type B sorting domain-containing protein [Flavobacterium ovatum]|uniref:T9SS type B sorting domain-containing protein n=1 Tax=Flavobacterium ovatum TaxID=1928857 RepID=UPI00344FC072